MEIVGRLCYPMSAEERNWWRRGRDERGGGEVRWGGWHGDEEGVAGLSHWATTFLGTTSQTADQIFSDYFERSHCTITTFRHRDYRVNQVFEGPLNILVNYLGQRFILSYTVFQILLLFVKFWDTKNCSSIIFKFAFLLWEEIIILC